MKRSVIGAMVLATMLATATLSHAGWFKNTGRSVGKVTRQVTDRGKSTYKRAREYTHTHKDQWRSHANDTYRRSKKAARDAHDGFREGYRGKTRRY